MPRWRGRKVLEEMNSDVQLHNRVTTDHGNNNTPFHFKAGGKDVFNDSISDGINVCPNFNIIQIKLLQPTCFLIRRINQAGSACFLPQDVTVISSKPQQSTSVR